MAKTVLTRPDASEYAEYYERYVGKITGTDIIEILKQQHAEIQALIASVPAEKENFRYAEGKWSIRELVGHVLDGERVFAYRALVFARNDQTPLPGFEQDFWVTHSNHGNVPLAELAAELSSVRQSTIDLFRHLAPDAWTNRGVANNKEMSVRAAAYVIAGHAAHHLDVLKSRYL